MTTFADLLRYWDDDSDEPRPQTSTPLPEEKLLLLLDIITPYTACSDARMFRVLKVLYTQLYHPHLTRTQYVAAVTCGIEAYQRGKKASDVRSSMLATITLLGAK